MSITRILFSEFSSSGDTSCFEVMILEDNVLEGEETVEISIFSEDVLVEPNDLVLIIQDESNLDGTYAVKLT